MILVDYGLRPEQTILYIAGQILNNLKRKPLSEEELLDKLFEENPKEYQVYRFELAVYLLLLLEKINYLSRGGDLFYVYRTVDY